MVTCIAALALTSHMGFGEEYSEIHPNISCTNESYIGSVLINSEGSVSIFNGILLGEYIDVGLATGYSGKEFLRPIARLKYKNWFLMPGYDGKPGVVLGINIPFGGEK